MFEYIIYVQIQYILILISFIILLNDYFCVCCIWVWKVDDLTRFLRIRSLSLPYTFKDKIVSKIFFFDSNNDFMLNFHTEKKLWHSWRLQLRSFTTKWTEIALVSEIKKKGFYDLTGSESDGFSLFISIKTAQAWMGDGHLCCMAICWWPSVMHLHAMTSYPVLK